ncbi:MAG: hypothetical protein Kow00121_17330 [Elainellaceae cyanobacterium]
MGRLDNLPDNIEPEDPRFTENILREMANDLRSLQQDLVANLHQDVQRLQAEKTRLIDDIESLRNQRQTLQTQQETALSRQQLAQQQVWAKQLALALANHLHAALAQRLSQSLSTSQIQRTVDISQVSISPQVDPENTYRMLASIDETINRAFTSLRHDLNSYQSALSQQISHMHDLGQQGEAILEVLVGRISQQLQSEVLKNRGGDRPISEPGVSSGFSPPPTVPPSNHAFTEINPSVSSINVPANAPPPPIPSAGIPPAGVPPTKIPSANVPPGNIPPGSIPPGNIPPGIPPANTPVVGAGSQAPRSASPQTEFGPDPTSAPVPVSEPTPVPARTPANRRSSPFQAGLILILFSTATLALHHVIVQIIGTEGRLFGSTALPIGGYISLQTFSSSLLLLWVRMVAIVPFMAWLSGLLYQPVWRDVRMLFGHRDRGILLSLIGSGIFLMLSQVFLYIAINEAGPAIAVTISSLYPLVTVPLMWMLFGDRPTRPRVVGILAIFLGISLTLFGAQAALSQTGVVAAVISGITFALYLIAMLIINRRKLNPVPISLIQNATIFVFSSVFLIGFGSSAAPNNWLGLAVGGFILGGLTIVSYFLNDVGSRLLGAARATLITASVPALTALLAFLIFPSIQNSLSLGQILGVLAVTSGIATLSLERVLSQYKAAARQARQKTEPSG